MKTRNKNQKEEKQQEAIPQPLIQIRDFKNPVISKQFAILLDANVISPMLTLRDKNHLMSVSKQLHGFFRKSFGEACLTQLLHSIIWGDPEKAEAIVKLKPHF